MTEIINQYREDDRKTRLADQADNWARDNRIITLRAAEQKEVQEQRAEKRKIAKTETV